MSPSKTRPDIEYRRRINPLLPYAEALCACGWIQTKEVFSRAHGTESRWHAMLEKLYLAERRVVFECAFHAFVPTLREWFSVSWDPPDESGTCLHGIYHHGRGIDIPMRDCLPVMHYTLRGPLVIPESIELHTLGSIAQRPGLTFSSENYYPGTESVHFPEA